ncbi:NAD/NADP-dependent octopine/nopaline dehydrogenase family protein [Candidatus Formimonas warabiya]|uniref:Glycerol-3-phosphate dehydrogenase n=1 Tax=Formimonas warabiya TaxID=1761012 RepID=A0A3G1KNN0_FORW1|nr:NAD/NADP-dependent octopine/nopaline dehydrogenase family protein [Candidatus Formimonas warabiya]ATW24068.1 glycerol-3-phosphate dehydrogenase [Candidatus Formimonas warabiya]
MEIAVLGGGNGAYAAAADLSEKGHRIRLWRRNQQEFKPVLEKQALILKDYRGTRLVRLALATGDLGQAVDGAQVILIPLPAFSQTDLAKELVPLVRDEQVILLTPGTFGSFVMAQEMRKAGCTAKLIFGETGTLPYLARKHGPDTIAITTRATRLPTGIFPGEETSPAFAIIKEVFPAAEPLRDVLDAALMNAGPIIHPPLILLNSAPIEYFDRWDIHNEGTQPSVRKIHDALDQERIATREILGYMGPHFPLSDHYCSRGDEWMYGNAAHEKLVDSTDWREKLDLYHHRYMQEDIGYGLAFLVSVAEWAGIPVPLANGLLSIASVITGTDFRNQGRTWGNLGLSPYSKEEFADLMKRGI